MKTREAYSIWDGISDAYLWEWCIWIDFASFFPPSKSYFSSHYRVRLISLPNVPYVFVYQLKNWKFLYNRRLRYVIRGFSFSSFQYVEKQNHVWRDFIFYLSLLKYLVLRILSVSRKFYATNAIDSSWKNKR